LDWRGASRLLRKVELEQDDGVEGQMGVDEDLRAATHSEHQIEREWLYH